jgi:hypothetical protein
MDIRTIVATANDSRERHELRTSVPNQKKIKHLFKPTKSLETASTESSRKY